MRLYAVWCARQVQHLTNDRRALDALDVAERHAHGQATAEELAAARDEAWAAASAAAYAVRDEAYAASDEASAAAYAARDAVSAAVSAAAREAQIAEFVRVFCS